MMLKRRAASSGATGSLDPRAAHHSTVTPAMLLVLLIVCATSYYLFSNAQITSTEQTVFDLLAVTQQVPAALAPEQVDQFVAGNLDHDHRIADLIGWAVQIMLLLSSFSIDSVLALIHQRHGGEPTPNGAALASWKSFCTYILVGGDVITDFYYVAKDHIVISWSGLIPNVTRFEFGALLVALIYPVAICSITFYSGKYSLIVAEALYAQLRRRQQHG